MSPLALLVVVTLAGQAPPAEPGPAPPPSEPSPSASTAAAPAPAAAPAERPRLLVLTLEAHDVDEAEAKVINSLLTDSMGRYPSFEVITQEDIRTLVDLESQREAVGCDSSSCLAEIAAAMGATYVVFGSIGRLGQTTLVQLNLFDSEKAKPVGRESARTSRVDTLPADIEEAAGRLLSALVSEDERAQSTARVAELRATEPEPLPGEGNASGGVSWALVGGGGALFGLAVLAGGASVAGFAVANLFLVNPTTDRWVKDASFGVGWGSVAIFGVAAVGGLCGAGLLGWGFLE